MTTHSLLLRCDEALALRDGRPWGAGAPSASRPWPLPQTLAGMLRSKVGLARRPDFFHDRSRAESLIKGVRLGLSLPAVRLGAHWEPLFPTPADAVGFPSERGIEMKTPVLHDFGLDWCDLQDSAGWLAPILEDARKPDSRAPAWWHSVPFLDWLAGKFPHAPGQSCALEAIGPPAPLRRWRTHTKIDPETGSAKERHLFSSEELVLRTRSHEWALALTARVAEAGDLSALGGCFHLGGDRRLAMAESLPFAWPSFPHEVFASPSQWLKIILITPGDFGGWLPTWLHPRAWCDVPGCGATRVRLRSATIIPAQGVSGWDFQLRACKATRFLVPAGSVYVLELENPDGASALASALWLQSLNADLNGHGYAVPGLLHHPVSLHS